MPQKHALAAFVLYLTLSAVVVAHGQDVAPARVEAAFGKGATIRNADDSLSLNIRGRIQARATLTEEDEDGEAPVTGMVVRRLRVVFQGNATGPHLTYYIQLAFSNQDMEPDLRSPLRDAYFTWTLARDAKLRVGQMKVPFDRQRVNSSSALQMADRSMVVGELNLDRDVGLQLFSKDLLGLGGKLGYSLGVFGGDGRNRLAEAFGLLYAARLELRPMGGFEDTVEADIERAHAPKLAVGIAFAYNQNTDRPRSTTGVPYEDARFDYVHAGADAIFKWRGFSAQAEALLRRADKNSRIGAVDGESETFYSRSAWGAFVQVGQMVTEHAEVCARYGYLEPLSGTDPELERAHELGPGASYYFREHNLKVQADYLFSPRSGGVLLAEGVRQGFDQGTHEVRLQTQLYF